MSELRLLDAAAAGDCRVSFADPDNRESATAQAIASLRREGVVVLDHLVDPAKIAACSAEIHAAYPDMARVDPLRNYGPYVGRHTMPMPIEGALADRDVFLPRPVAEIASAMLGKAYKFDSLGLLVSIPGAPDQKPHADATLFPEVVIDPLLPCFALAFSLPLVPLDEISGTTAFWRRSHRSPRVSGEPDLEPMVQPGSAILWDYRIRHFGRANRGARPRPIIFSALSREWWVDIDPPGAVLYEKLQVARAAHAGLSLKLQNRLSRARLTD